MANIELRLIGTERGLEKQKLTLYVVYSKWGEKANSEVFLKCTNYGKARQNLTVYDI